MRWRKWRCDCSSLLREKQWWKRPVIYMDGLLDTREEPSFEKGGRSLQSTSVFTEPPCDPPFPGYIAWGYSHSKVTRKYTASGSKT